MSSSSSSKEVENRVPKKRNWMKMSSLRAEQKMIRNLSPLIPSVPVVVESDDDSADEVDAVSVADNGVGAGVAAPKKFSWLSANNVKVVMLLRQVSVRTVGKCSVLVFQE